ncbi:kinase-like protein [Metschnikowia bicuspidata var. bicuspidata NRRL YB-4993]|uniref:non-specific serine/threonine protein kinase n=1 Tax=Metschnikowia bicuspidata var. bicuspidata NRRL YB-4993 TaxID=869754 RepID=A0A1A0HIC3_9ASCO|nr:kinase-like protein [Metschnikowia bicuspidata var. bicuspidata NRRL YB-4993]OBA23755.1 kinase-like protein [Metschnikowia bicuspidata var. bicuspidata NRRL YB-4993]
MPPPPANALPPGTPLTVGSHQIQIRKYISEGGFAHVYSCTIEPAFNGNSTACLKRVVVPNKWQLTLLRQEVDAMKRLRGNAHIVSYIDSHALRLPPASADAPQQYEVLLLMEFCAGKGLIDFMNTRLTNRLTEREILLIIGQITTAVAMCHHLVPPLIHRDIKIENVLIDGNGTYKLCDFGSAVEYSKPPATQAELTALQNDIMLNTTPQYRAPEMIDFSRGFPVDDKLDIWALGVLLYKLCYYTTPFELPQQKSLQDLHALILNCTATLRFPSSPPFSARLQNVIHCCLRADPRRRPNALQLLQEICMMQNVHTIPDVVPYSPPRNQPDLPKRHIPPKAQPEVPRRHTEIARKLPPAKPPVDLFAQINKSKLLNMGRSTPIKPRPKSEIHPSTSAASLLEYVKLQVSESNVSIPQARVSEDTDRSTLQFLRSKETEDSNSRQNTGGSFKASLKNSLRRISTGGSLSSQRSGSFSTPRQSSSSEKSSSEEHLKPVGEKPLKRGSSIQRRVQQLWTSKEKKAAKTASGYGRYTEQDDISAINHNTLSTHTSVESLVSPKTEAPASFEFNQKSGNKMEPQVPATRPLILAGKKQAHMKDTSVSTRPLPKVRPSSEQSAPPPCPPALSVRSSGTSLETAKTTPGDQDAVRPRATAGKKKAPPKPAKPQHLKNASERKLSTSSEVSLPDLDDLEKQFARRFPSYV